MIVLSGPETLDRALYDRVVRDEERIELAADALERVDAARARMLAALDAGTPAYGVTTRTGLIDLAERVAG